MVKLADMLSSVSKNERRRYPFLVVQESFPAADDPPETDGGTIDEVIHDDEIVHDPADPAWIDDDFNTIGAHWTVQVVGNGTGVASFGATRSRATLYNITGGGTEPNWWGRRLVYNLPFSYAGDFTVEYVLSFISPAVTGMGQSTVILNTNVGAEVARAGHSDGWNASWGETYTGIGGVHINTGAGTYQGKRYRFKIQRNAGTINIYINGYRIQTAANAATVAQIYIELLTFTANWPNHTAIDWFKAYPGLSPYEHNISFDKRYGVFNVCEGGVSVATITVTGYNWLTATSNLASGYYHGFVCDGTGTAAKILVMVFFKPELYFVIWGLGRQCTLVTTWNQTFKLGAATTDPEYSVIVHRPTLDVSSASTMGYFPDGTYDRIVGTIVPSHTSLFMQTNRTTTLNIYWKGTAYRTDYSNLIASGVNMWNQAGAEGSLTPNGYGWGTIIDGKFVWIGGLGGSYFTYLGVDCISTSNVSFEVHESYPTYSEYLWLDYPMCEYINYGAAASFSRVIPCAEIRRHSWKLIQSEGAYYFFWEVEGWAVSNRQNYLHGSFDGRSSVAILARITGVLETTYFVNMDWWDEAFTLANAGNLTLGTPLHWCGTYTDSTGSSRYFDTDGAFVDPCPNDFSMHDGTLEEKITMWNGDLNRGMIARAMDYDFDGSTLLDYVDYWVAPGPTFQRRVGGGRKNDAVYTTTEGTYRGWVLLYMISLKNVSTPDGIYNYTFTVNGTNVNALPNVGRYGNRYANAVMTTQSTYCALGYISPHNEPEKSYEWTDTWGTTHRLVILE